MRKSTLIVLFLLLGVCVFVLFMADTLVGPIKEDLETAKRVSQALESRGDLASGTKIKIRRLKPEPTRPGPGLLVELTPSVEILARPGGLRGLVRAVATEWDQTQPQGAAERIRWFEFRLLVEGAPSLDTWVTLAADNQVEDPVPPLPDTWPPRPVGRPR
jgi:hypothetical protein